MYLIADYVIAKYIRLSQEDRLYDSLSISHQHMQLDRHIEELDIPNITVLDFVDNGYTGTNMERPALQEMLDLVWNGGVNCIIVKDFSRFFRESIESSFYIERVFPLLQVRFIAIGEGFDSDDYKDSTGGLDVSFRFLMHEYYSQDLSKKIRSALHTKMRNGELIAAGIYGYRKNTDGKWEPDPEAAEVVQMIYRMALEGFSTSQIRDWLYNAKYPTPREYMDMKLGKDVSLKYLWNTSQIYNILTNEQYIGSYVTGKFETAVIGSRRTHRTDKSKWLVIPDRHPTIVSKEDFAKVQGVVRFRKGPHAVKAKNGRNNTGNRGDKKSKHAPYGYIKTDSGGWIVDEKAGAVIRSIFEMAIQGRSPWQICEVLNDAGHPVPSEHVKLVLGYDIQPSRRWSRYLVWTVISNKLYADMQPPIISVDAYNQARESVTKNSYKNRRKSVYLLSGKAVCGCCGCALSYRDVTKIKTYNCRRMLADPTAQCYKMRVVASELEDAVMAVIYKQAMLFLEPGNVIEGNEAALYEQNTISTDSCTTQLALLVEQYQQAYEQFTTGMIDQEHFNNIRAEFLGEKKTLENRLSLLKQAGLDKQADQKVKAVVESAVNNKATPQDIVNALVDKVLVFPGDKLEIRWKFADFTMLG